MKSRLPFVVLVLSILVTVQSVHVFILQREVSDLNRNVSEIYKQIGDLADVSIKLSKASRNNSEAISATIDRLTRLVVHLGKGEK